MKKIIVASDSHSNKAGLDKIFNNETFDYLIFLGDYISDLGNYANLENVCKVRGNWDFFSNEKRSGVLQVEGVKIFYCHGHEYSVKSGLKKIIEAGKCLDADIVLFGHTHKYYYEKQGNMHIINCPSLNILSGGEGSYLVIEIDDKKISILKREI